MRVCFQKYAGQEYWGLDGEMYRVMQDRSVAGTQGLAHPADLVPAADLAPGIVTAGDPDQTIIFSQQQETV